MSNKKDKHRDVVYSTDVGRICPDCGNPIDSCDCAQRPFNNKGDGVVRISRETKGRRGKCVTVIKGIPLPPPDLKKLEKRLKATCGTGGTIKNGAIEIQGDFRDRLLSELQKQGWEVRQSGG